MTDCGICHGEGATRYTEREVCGDVEFTSSGIRPCACREVMMPRPGQAHYWSEERVFEEFVDCGVQRGISVHVDAEVPMSADNYRLVRRGNRYWPSLVNVGTSWMHPGEARVLAAALIRAAEAADAIDQPDADVCGHWFPCECDAAKTKRSA